MCGSGSDAADLCQRGRYLCVPKKTILKETETNNVHKESSMAALNLALSPPPWPRVFNKGDLCRLPSGRAQASRCCLNLVPHYFGPIFTATAGIKSVKAPRVS